MSNASLGSVPQPLSQPRAAIVSRGGTAIAILIAVWMALNAYSYSMVAAIPLIQSDAWRFLDGFLGQFIEEGFSVGLLFAQVNPADTNLPLQKLILFFHTRFYGMDFRVEGVIGTLSGIALVVVVARAATSKALATWGGAEAWLLAALGLSLLSLNSSNVFTWPLATLWYLPILVATAYMWTVFAAPDARFRVFAASFVLGVLLDEVSYPAFLATIGAMILAPHWRSFRQAGLTAACGVAGIAASRVAYWLFALADAAPGAVPPESGRSFAGLVDPEVWKALLFPLSDSVVHQANAVPVFGPAGPALATAIGVLLVVAHLWFWWRVVFAMRDRPEARITTHIAAALMLLFYALVAGIVIQRIPVFGFDYLHQPRYVLFYEVNLAALAVLAYREYRHSDGRPIRSLVQVAAIVGVLSFAGLQVRLSNLAWEQVKYLSTYLEGASLTMGRLAMDPGAELECADIMTVCQFPPGKRKELMERLRRHELNLFSPEFQSFHRLRPYPAEADG